MKWIFEKFQGDMAIYAQCPKCNFRHNTSTFDSTEMRSSITRQYKYCPMCGEHLYDDREEIEVIWNEKDIVELYK